MAIERVLSEEAGPIEAVVDTGITTIVHFQNPAQEFALDLLSEILRWERRCLIPTSTLLGAYHIMTEYLGVERVGACRALTNTLRTNSPALFPDISIDLAVDALINANGYRIEVWDGYIFALARAVDAPMIYSIDVAMSRRLREVEVVNPIPEEEYEEYKKWLKENFSRSR